MLVLPVLAAVARAAPRRVEGAALGLGLFRQPPLVTLEARPARRPRGGAPLRAGAGARARRGIAR